MGLSKSSNMEAIRADPEGPRSPRTPQGAPGGRAAGGPRSARGGAAHAGRTSDGPREPRSPKGGLALSQAARKGGSDSKARRAVLQSTDTEGNHSQEKEPGAQTALTCQQRRGRRHLVPEKETRARGESSRGPNPAPTRLPRRADCERVLPGPRASGPTHFRRRSAQAQLGGASGLRVRGPAARRSPSLSRGRSRTSAGRSPPSADVGSRTRSSSRRRAAPSRCCVCFLFLSTLLAADERRREKSLQPAPCSRAPRWPGPPARRRPPAPRAPPASPRARRAQAQRPQPAPVPSASSPRRRGLRGPSLSAARGPSERGGGPAGRGRRREDGRQAADPDGQREAQQEHHAARQRRQDLEKRPRGEGVGGTLAAGALHLRGLRLGNFPDNPEYQDGHVKSLTLRRFILL